MGVSPQPVSRPDAFLREGNEGMNDFNQGFDVCLGRRDDGAVY